MVIVRRMVKKRKGRKAACSPCLPLSIQAALPPYLSPPFYTSFTNLLTVTGNALSRQAPCIRYNRGICVPCPARNGGAGTCIKAKSKEHCAMSTHDNQRREHPSTYFVQDRSNEEEL